MEQQLRNDNEKWIIRFRRHEEIGSLQGGGGRRKYLKKKLGEMWRERETVAL